MPFPLIFTEACGKELRTQGVYLRSQKSSSLEFYFGDKFDNEGDKEACGI